MMTFKNINRNVTRRSLEHQEQAELMRIVGLHLRKYPELRMLFAIPNGGQRHIAVARKLKAEGVKAGVPDLFISCARQGRHGLFIEMKAGKNKQTPAQLEFAAAAISEGYAVEVCYSAAAAWERIESYLKGGRNGKS